MVDLPYGVRSGCFTPAYQVIAFAVGLTAVMSEGEQTAWNFAHKVIDSAVAGHRFTRCFGKFSHLPANGSDRQRWSLTCQPLYRRFDVWRDNSPAPRGLRVLCARGPPVRTFDIGLPISGPSEMKDLRQPRPVGESAALPSTAESAETGTSQDPEPPRTLGSASACKDTTPNNSESDSLSAP